MLRVGAGCALIFDGVWYSRISFFFFFFWKSMEPAAMRPNRSTWVICLPPSEPNLADHKYCFLVNTDSPSYCRPDRRVERPETPPIVHTESSY